MKLTPLSELFLHSLLEIDEGIASRVAAQGCSHCAGPLHRADYPRKPRGGWLAAVGEAFSKRISFCCGRRGCRKRATPPSVRFLGRRVYLGVTVVMASALMVLGITAGALERASKVPARTVRRWGQWWRNGFVQSRLFREQGSQFLPPLSIPNLPVSLLERWVGSEAPERLRPVCAFLAPLTTGSVVDRACFVRLN